MNIFVIHDPRRPDEEFLQMLGELTRQGLTEWMETIHPTFIQGEETVEENINRTHKRCVRKAKEVGLEEVCILESDVVFPAVDGWAYFLKNKPEEFDIYMGGCYGPIVKSCFPANNNIAYPVEPVAGFHCYIVRSRYYDKYLSVPDDEHIDEAQMNVIGAKIKVCFPMAAIQRPGWSANAKAKVNYNYILQPGDVYGDASAYGVGQKHPS